MLAWPGATTRSAVGGAIDRWTSPMAGRAWRSLGVLTLVQAAAMVLAASAQAQTNACDLLKVELAARIESTGVRVYTLEAVPANAPVPPDAKAIGNCEAGAFKVLYSRRGAAGAPSEAASASSRVASAAAPGPASAAKAVVVPDEPARRAPGVQSGRGLLSPPLANARSVALPPASRSSEAAAALPTPRQGLEKPLTAGAKEAEAPPAVERPVAPTVPAVVDKPPEAKAPLAPPAPGFMAENWRWIGALALLAVVAWVWVWRAQRGAYDKSGLPRGPRL